MKDEKEMAGELDGDVSFDLVIERRERSYSFGEPRVGAVLAFGDQSERLALATHAATEFEIRTIVEQFENLPRNRVLESHGVLTTDPYVSVTGGQTMTVDRAAVEKWVQGEVFREARDQADCPATIVNFNATVVDSKTATAVYSIHQDGKMANSTVTVVKNDDGQWRIAVHSQHPV